MTHIVNGEIRLSEYDEEHLGDLLAGEGDWFDAILLRLIAKSDPDHREAIRKGFPRIVEAYERWFRKAQLDAAEQTLDEIEGDMRRQREEEERSRQAELDDRAKGEYYGGPNMQGDAQEQGHREDEENADQGDGPRD